MARPSDHEYGQASYKICAKNLSRIEFRRRSIESIASRNRYRFAFLWSVVVISLFLVCFILLLPLQRTQLVLIHHADDGTVWTELPRHQKLTTTLPETKSNLVRYVVNRESYSPSAYIHHYVLVNLLSNAEVAKEYQQTQSRDNPDSPINHFKRRITRSVRVQNIIFLKNDPKHPLAQVNFTITDRDRTTGRLKK